MKKLGYLLALIPLCVIFILGGCASKGGNQNNGDETPSGTTPSVAIDQSSLALFVGDEGVIAVTTENCADFTVESSNGDVVTATKGENGVVSVKALAEGEATVTVKGVDGEGKVLDEKTCAVTVENVPEEVNPIKINLPSGKLVLRKNRTATVKAFVSVAYTDDPIWESDNDDIATVEFQGLTAIITTHDTSGDCTITLTIGEMTQTFTVSCGVK